MEKVDLIIYNAKIYTVDSNFTIEQSFAVKDGKFLEIGSDDEILKKYVSNNLINNNGLPIYPGFYDPHCHFTGYGRSLQYADLTGTKSFDEILEIIIKHHNDYPSDWILGRGWDQNDWTVKEFPDNKKLNELFPDIPVMLTRIDGHAVIANNKALEIGNITFETKINGGKILKSDINLTGVLLDNAADYLKDLVPEPSKEQKIKNLLNAQSNCFAVGLTTVGDAGLKKDEVLLIDSLQNIGLLKMKVYAMLTANEENLNYFIKNGIYKTDNLNVRSVKLYADGALGSRGAALLEPYSDDIDNYGIMVISSDSLSIWCKIGLGNGYQINTHAIGDSANRIVLKTYAENLETKNDFRWRIEHCQVINEEDFHFFGDYSIIPSVQSTHATSDMYWAEERLGKERIKNAYAYKKLLDENDWLANGSDFPIENINPLYGFYALVSRKDLENFPENGFQPENALSREEAMKSMTIWAAKSCFEENEKGSIEIGKFADFVILNADIMQISENEIFLTKVLKTYINGTKIEFEN
jgi:predicted amidohydrolase YtcJ